MAASWSCGTIRVIEKSEESILREGGVFAVHLTRFLLASLEGGPRTGKTRTCVYI